MTVGSERYGKEVNRAMSREGKYIYGILQEANQRTFEVTGIEGAPVYTLCYGDLAAAVSDTGLEEIDPSRRNVLAHTAVQERLMQDYDLIPASFGTVAANAEQTRELLRNNHDGLLESFGHLCGKMEADLKVTWSQEAMMRRIEGENGKLAELRRRVKDAPSAAEAHRLLIEAGRLVEQVAAEWKSGYAQRAYDALKELSVDARTNDPIRVTEILNASFLLDKSTEDEFKREVYRLDTECGGDVDFKYIGPLPPYNFISLKLEPVG
jgi:hypothetical protein